MRVLMVFSWLRFALLCCCGCAVLALAVQPALGTARPRIGPNVRVSYDSESAHTEPMLAVNPNNRENLIASSAVFAGGNGALQTAAYASTDGGNRWMESDLPAKYRGGSVDNVVAFGSSGTAYLSLMPAPNGTKEPPALYVFRSTDGGFTWQPPAQFCKVSCDHEHLTVDRSSGKNRGTVYVDVNGSEFHGHRSTAGIFLFRSSDDGRSFTGPLIVTKGARSLVNLNSLVFRDGSVFVPYQEFRALDTKMPNAQAIYFKTSDDAGRTFSIERKVDEQVIYSAPILRDHRHSLRFDEPALPEFAVDATPGEFGDRLYVAWSDVRYGRPRIFFRFSSDRGLTWSPVRLLNADVPSWSSQYQPAIAVNNAGVVGVAWFDTRGSRRQDRYHEYFAASHDGGEHFGDGVAVSSAPSFPRSAGNLRLGIEDNGPEYSSHRIDLWSAFAHWPQAGDYMGLDADSAGIFHPLWTDGRTNAWQLETAQVDTAGTPTVRPATRHASLTKLIALVPEPASYDPLTRETALPVRLRNISQQPLYGPFEVNITMFKRWDIISRLDHAQRLPIILNASNGGRGTGATYDYSRVLGDFSALVPGSVTEPVVWRFRSEPYEAPYFEVEIGGYLPASR